MRPTLPTNRVFVSMTALRHNFREIRQLAGERLIMAVVKADGYGHGLVSSALTLSQAGADALGVMTVEDGLTLRALDLRLPIHILGGLTDPEDLESIIRNDLRLFVGSLTEARLLADKAAELGMTARFHLKIDTGLGRRGLPSGQALDLTKEIAAWPHLQILGLATHLATAGDQGAHQQLLKFDQLCLAVNELGLTGSLDTALGSGGLIWHSGHHTRMVRVGLMLYGLHPGPEIGPVRPDLRPAMTVVSRVTCLRDLEPGDTVGYGRTFVARKATRLAVVPFGYSQGLLRSRSNRGWVLIRGRKAPQVGLISMSSSTYDVTDIPDVACGDNVVIVGRHGPHCVRAGDLAAWAATTPYEILNLLGRLNPRFTEGSDYEEDAGR